MADGHGVMARSDLDAEGACLGAALTDHGAALELVELLQPEDYYSVANRWMHQAMRDIIARGDTVDLVSVVGQLRNARRLDEVGGASYVAQLVGGPVVRLEQAARTVRGWARVRRAVQVFRELAAEGSVAEIPDVAEWLDSCERRAYAATATDEDAAEHSATYADAWDLLQADWDQARERGGTFGLASGYHQLDEHTLGMQPGQLWFVGARPGQGKTAFAQQLAEHVAIRGQGRDAVVICSMEMSRKELLLRAVSRFSERPHRAIAKRSLDQAGWGAVADARQRMHELPIFIDDRKRLTPIQVRGKIRRGVSELHKRPELRGARLRLVVVDYVQLMRPDQERRGGTRAEELGTITGALKAMAGELDCTVLALSQLTRPADKNKAPPAPTLFDFRDSGAIEADGDVVIGLHRPDQYLKPGETPTGICEVHVLKGRASGENAFELLFEGSTTQFRNTEPGQDRLWRDQQ